MLFSRACCGLSVGCSFSRATAGVKIRVPFRVSRVYHRMCLCSDLVILGCCDISIVLDGSVSAVGFSIRDMRCHSPTRGIST